MGKQFVAAIACGTVLGAMFSTTSVPAQTIVYRGTQPTVHPWTDRQPVVPLTLPVFPLVNVNGLPVGGYVTTGQPVLPGWGSINPESASRRKTVPTTTTTSPAAAVAHGESVTPQLGGRSVEPATANGSGGPLAEELRRHGRNLDEATTRIDQTLAELQRLSRRVDELDSRSRAGSGDPRTAPSRAGHGEPRTAPSRAGAGEPRTDLEQPAGTARIRTSSGIPSGADRSTIRPSASGSDAVPRAVEREAVRPSTSAAPSPRVMSDLLR